MAWGSIGKNRSCVSPNGSTPIARRWRGWRRGIFFILAFASRAEIAAEIARASEAPHGPEGPIYPGTCRHLNEDERKTRIASGTAYALRLDVAKAVGRILELTFNERGQGPNGEHGIITVDPLLFGDIVLARRRRQPPTI